MDRLAPPGAVFAIFVQLVSDPGGDRFCVSYETHSASAQSGALSEADAREYLARAGAADVDRVLAEARALVRRG